MSAPLIASSTGKYLTTCRLCPPNSKQSRVAESVPLEIPIIGNPGEKAAKLMAVLYKHLTKFHQQELTEGSALASEVPAFFILAAFESQDPTLTARLEQVRSGLFAIVRKNSMSNESLQYIVSGLGLDPEDAAKVLEAFKTVRDACCEFGQYAPKVPPAVKSLLFTS